MVERAADPLRPACALAVEVARAGELAGLPAPPTLRRLLRFAKRPEGFWEGVRRAVEGDEAFRERVALAADEEEVGRAGLLWLRRPEGWEADLAAALGEARETASREDEARAEARASARAERLLVREREGRIRAEAAAAQAEEQLAQARRRLTAERRERDAAEDRAARAEEQREAAVEERTGALRALKEAEARAARAAAERSAARRELRRMAGELDAARARLAGPGGAGSGGARGSAPKTAPVVEPAAAAESLRRAARGAAELASALGELAADLELAQGGQPSGSAGSNAPGPGAAAPEGGERGGGPPANEPPRAPTALPGGVFDDSPEAAEHLVRQPGAVVVVDGYNVSKKAWGDLAPPEQRTRLLDALGELAARTGAEFDVVFDGAEVPHAAPASARRPGVRVRFSPPDLDADDVVVAAVDAWPATRPVVVASSDNRVRDGARQRGANVIHAAQLLRAANR